ncbi:hypothetical protein RHMOL_Rhmol12G0132800 [Rhododendron molle]|uniref:Uncharacterized protein n=1 Tax=Rhododendron molle TaxID=49168 RepID=A0ACC0LHT6_RHOML|nr:hypothetical protein RHMOL_Rhmol12G0132800 [Rhododendron molle]
MPPYLNSDNPLAVNHCEFPGKNGGDSTSLKTILLHPLGCFSRIRNVCKYSATESIYIVLLHCLSARIIPLDANNWVQPIVNASAQSQDVKS